MLKKKIGKKKPKPLRGLDRNYDEKIQNGIETVKDKDNGNKSTTVDLSLTQKEKKNQTGVRNEK